MVLLNEHIPVDSPVRAFGVLQIEMAVLVIANHHHRVIQFNILFDATLALIWRSTAIIVVEVIICVDLVRCWCFCNKFFKLA